MPTLARSDFQHISHKEGNVFFNQHTRKLDVRGGNFLSRLVTWIKSKYNPGRIHQEYQEAADSFIREVRQIHNLAFGKYDEDYQISEDHLNELYELGSQGKPLAARQVRQVLTRLDIVPGALAMAENYFSPAHCRKQLIMEISSHPELSGPYKPGSVEIEKLSAHIKSALMKEICRQEGSDTEEMLSSMTQKMIKEYVASRLDTLKMAFNCSGFEHCQEKIAEGLSKRPELFMRYSPDPMDIEELDLNIKAAIVDESLRPGVEMTQADASSIAEKAITQHTEQLIKVMKEQEVDTDIPIMRRTSKTDAEKEDKTQTEEFIKQTAQKTATKQATQRADKKNATQADVKETTSHSQPLQTASSITENSGEAIDEKTTSQQLNGGKQPDESNMSQTNTQAPVEEAETLITPADTLTDTEKMQESPPASAEQTVQAGKGVSGGKKFDQFIEKVKSKKLKLPSEIEKQITSGEITSMKKLIKANNQYIANQITHTSIRGWYAEKYSKVRPKPPRGMEQAVLTEVKKLIQNTPNIVDHNAARDYAKKVITGYVNRHVR